MHRDADEEEAEIAMIVCRVVVINSGGRECADQGKT